MRLESLTRSEWIFPDLSGSDGQAVLRDLASRVTALRIVGDTDAEALYLKLQEREELGSTGIGEGVAIPHCKLAGLSEVLVAIGICREGVEFGASDAQPVKLFFLVISPENAPAEHLRSLAVISKWVKAEHHVERILDLEEAGEILQLLEQEPAE